MIHLNYTCNSSNADRKTVFGERGDGGRVRGIILLAREIKCLFGNYTHFENTIFLISLNSSPFKGYPDPFDYECALKRYYFFFNYSHFLSSIICRRNPHSFPGPAVPKLKMMERSWEILAVQRMEDNTNATMVVNGK